MPTTKFSPTERSTHHTKLHPTHIHPVDQNEQRVPRPNTDLQAQSIYELLNGPRPKPAQQTPEDKHQNFSIKFLRTVHIRARFP